MIVIRLSGGLGNQMFQYALYLQLKKLGREVSFDDETEYRTVLEDGTIRERRPRMLDRFGITLPRVSPEDLVRMTDSDLHLTSRIRRKVTGRRSAEIHDQDLIFDPSFLEREDGYFCGCFQSPRYFDGAVDQVKEAFTFPASIEEEPGVREMADRIRQSASAGRACMVHLRFGDYVEKKDIYGGICTDAYYDAAMAHVRKTWPKTTFYIFSNDPLAASEWIRARKDQGEFVLVEGNDEDHGYRDLYLMTLCTDHIMANSSFSFWGAFLSRDQGLTIAPSVWVHDRQGRELARRDIYTGDMILVNPTGRVLGSAADPFPRPLVTIGVTAYNLEKYIERALESVCRQTLDRIEIIAVDDGSTDRTGSIMDKMADTDPRIRVIHQANAGISAARNAVIDHASGEWIGFIDGDDWPEPGYYELLLEGALLSGSQIAMTSYREVSQKEGPLAGADKQAGDRRDQIGRALRESTCMDRKGVLRAYVDSARTDNSAPIRIYNSVWSKLFSRQALLGIRFAVGRRSEDIMFTTLALGACDHAVYLPARMYNYVSDRTKSIMNSRLGERRLSDEIPFWHDHMEYLKSAGLPELADRAEYLFYRRLLMYEEEMYPLEQTRPYADRITQMLQDKRSRVEELIREGYGNGGGDDRRLSMFVSSPERYRRVSGLYKRTVIPLRRLVKR